MCPDHKIKIQKPTFKSIDPHVFIDGISISMDAGSKCPAIEINNKASAYLYFYGGDSDLRGADYRAAIQKNRSEGDLHILVAGGTKLYLLRRAVCGRYRRFGRSQHELV